MTALAVPFGASEPPPSAGARPMLATYDDERVVVWQAHGEAVARRALETGRFDGPGWRTDRTTRMRLSLPSLAWRTQYGTRPGRERLLAVTLRREGFDEVVRRAIPAEYDPALFATEGSWRLATRYASATVSWHPDRDAQGAPVAWQTARFGLHAGLLDAFSHEWVVGVEDHTAWLADRSRVPVVRPYPLESADVR